MFLLSIIPPLHTTWVWVLVSQVACSEESGTHWNVLLLVVEMPTSKHQWAEQGDPTGFRLEESL